MKYLVFTTKKQRSTSLKKQKKTKRGCKNYFIRVYYLLRLGKKIY